MKVLILAGGYGTRLARDLEKHADAYPHLVGVAKPLLPVAGKPLISHWMDMLRQCPQTYNIKEIYIVVYKLIISLQHCNANVVMVGERSISWSV